MFLNREWYKKFFRKQVAFQESGRRKLREAFLPYGCEFSNADADALLSDYWKDYVSMCRLFDDVSKCFAQLQGYKLGVITNGQETQQVEKLRQCGILSVFDVVVTSEAAGFPKPQPQIFQYACPKLGVQEKESVYVGDNLELDAIAARDTGFVGVWLNRLHRNAEYSIGSVERINHLTELCELLVIL
ncbi:HAD family hydrolase [Nostoc sp.]|uniref:HAD family hydrolase n=1 Tax=Nostoc sp. TaxID=1180 RepID=UPI002FF7E350